MAMMDVDGSSHLSADSQTKSAVRCKPHAAGDGTIASQPGSDRVKGAHVDGGLRPVYVR